MEIRTEDGPGPGLERDRFVDDELKSRSPVGFSGSQYCIGVKELIIEWDDMVGSREICGYIECFQCESPIIENINMKRLWLHNLSQFGDIKKDTQLLRFVKPPGRQTTFISIENASFYGLELHSKNGIRRNYGEHLDLPEQTHDC